MLQAFKLECPTILRPYGQIGGEPTQSLTRTAASSTSASPVVPGAAGSYETASETRKAGSG